MRRKKFAGSRSTCGYRAHWTAFGVGGLLAVAGVLMQVLLRNPLAEPYILGTSGGAAVAALFAMTLGLGAVLVDAAAFAGALGANLLVFAIAQGSGSWAPADCCC
ncbi:MAG: iron chelate uptake ABC transporter family permease subunit [Woeseiaceae bacterium]|nr:iron chelate uptake ABC transporter family permease subunit [Woeseiaceae bacterium]